MMMLPIGCCRDQCVERRRRGENAEWGMMNDECGWREDAEYGTVPALQLRLADECGMVDF